MVNKFHQINRNLEQGNEVLQKWIDKEEDKLAKKHDRFGKERKSQLTVRKATEKINEGLKQEVAAALETKEAKVAALGNLHRWPPVNVCVVCRGAKEED